MRIRIAGELHDGVMQQITALGLMLGTGKRQVELDAKATMADVQLGDACNLSARLRLMPEEL